MVDNNRSAVAKPRITASLVWPVVVAVGWAVAAIYLTQVTSLPRALRQGLDDTAAHFGLGILVAGCLICVVRALGWRDRRLLVGGLVAAALGVIFLVGTELLQAPSLVRQPELIDAVADIAGVILVTTVLLGSFRARAPLPERAATGFVAVASVVLVAVVLAVIVSPAAPVRERALPLQEAAEAETTECIADFAVLPDGGSSGRSGQQPAAEPLLRFDLAADLDRSQGSSAPVELVPQGTVRQSPGVGAVFAGAQDGLTSSGPVDELLADVTARQQFSVDVWLGLDDFDQTGPARIVAFAAGTTRAESNFHLGVEGDQVSVRLRTACDETNWVVVGPLATGANHLALTFDHGEVTVYFDGVARLRYRLVDADLAVWLPSVPLSIGNEATLNRPLRATVSSLAVWPTVLTDGEVAFLATDSERRDALTP